MGKRPITVRMARWSAEHPWRAMALWVVLVAVGFLAGSATGQREVTQADQRIGEAGRADAIASAGHFAAPPIDHVLITARGGALDPAAAQAAATDAANRLRVLP